MKRITSEWPSGSWAVRKRYGVAASCSWQPHVPLFAQEEILLRQSRLRQCGLLLRTWPYVLRTALRLATPELIFLVCRFWVIKLPGAVYCWGPGGSVDYDGPNRLQRV
jgi:hypothetical protein